MPTSTKMFPRRLLLLVAAATATHAEVIVTGNPHGNSGSSGDTCPQQIVSDKENASGAHGVASGSSIGRQMQCVGPEHLTPENVITAVLNPLQPETIRSIVPVKMRNGGYGATGSLTGFSSSFRAPVYHFVQSPRLVDEGKQLPFKLLLLRQVNSRSVVSIPVDGVSARDSWFPGYKWDLLLCANWNTVREAATGAAAGEQDSDSPAAEVGSIQVQHLGWRFSRVDDKTGAAVAGDEFFAVIVEHKDEEEMAVRNKAKLGLSLQFANLLKNNLPDELPFGGLEVAPRSAEKWMLTALAAAMKFGGKTGSVLR